jgi:hypothetical protein
MHVGQIAMAKGDGSKDRARSDKQAEGLFGPIAVVYSRAADVRSQP